MRRCGAKKEDKKIRLLYHVSPDSGKPQRDTTTYVPILAYFFSFVNTQFGAILTEYDTNLYKTPVRAYKILISLL